MKKILPVIAVVALLSGCEKDNSTTEKKDKDELIDAKVIAFPGAEGAGKFTKGGRGRLSHDHSPRLGPRIIQDLKRNDCCFYIFPNAQSFFNL